MSQKSSHLARWSYRHRVINVYRNATGLKLRLTVLHVFLDQHPASFKRMIVPGRPLAERVRQLQKPRLRGTPDRPAIRTDSGKIVRLAHQRSNNCRQIVVAAFTTVTRHEPQLGCWRTRCASWPRRESGALRVSHSCAIDQPAQQESCFTSLTKVCAASFRPSTIVR